LRSWWEQSCGNQKTPHAYAVFEVDAQDCDRGSPACGPADQSCACPPEMPLPLLTAWVKELHDLAGDGVNAAEIARFAEIAQVARPTEIVEAIRSGVFSGDDVFDMEREMRDILLADLAVFATIPCPISDTLAKC
jgi:hypothetical protein